MEIEEQILDNNVTLLAVKGDFWGGEEWELQEAVVRAINDERTNLVVDFSKVKRMNSQGIGVLVSCLTTVRDAGGNLKIAGANKNISEHLDLLNLYTIIERFDESATAAASFNV
jgi:anti-sigma B factor antagonist